MYTASLSPFVEDVSLLVVLSLQLLEVISSLMNHKAHFSLLHVIKESVSLSEW